MQQKKQQQSTRAPTVQYIHNTLNKENYTMSQ